jgi:poly(hydroxyalkanoate) depolymerase family esterase
MISLDQDDMNQALSLTKSGRLAEATELIQRTLGSRSARSPVSAQPQPPRAAADPKPASSSDTDRRNPLGAAAKALQRSLGSSFGSPQGAQIPAQSPDMLLRQGTRSDSLGEGVLLDRMYQNDAGARRYKIYVPPDSNQRAPVIVMLHGGTQPVLDYAAGTGMNQLADLHHFLVVYPEQDARANPMRYWNWFRPQDQQPRGGEPSLIAGITHEVIGDENADPDRVFIAGFSAGAAMATVMAATHPQLYAAAGVHSGLPYGAAHDVPSAFALMRGGSPTSHREPPLRIPLIVFHGDHDEIVNVVNASNIRQQRLGIDGVVTAADGVRVTHGQVPGGHPYTKTIYSDDADVLLEQWIVHGAGHAWFGGTAGCSYTDPRGPAASAEMVRFFAERRRRQGP